MADYTYKLVGFIDKTIIYKTEPITYYVIGNTMNSAINIYSGNGYIAGVATLKGEPIANSKLTLYSEDTGAMVMETETNLGGEYRFDKLSTSKRFFIVLKEPSGLWEYRVQSKILPVI